MANLIPSDAKRGITVEYWVRVVSVWLVMLGTVALIVAALNVPVYILIQNQLQTYSSLYTDASEQKTSFDKVEADITFVNAAATLLNTVNTYPLIVPYIEKLEALLPEAVQVNSFDLVRAGTVIKEVRLTGVAKDRESLVALSKSIEATEEFQSADIPLSNLAKDTDIPFNISAVISTTP